MFVSVSRVRFVLAALALALVAAACGSSDDVGSASAATSTSPVTPSVSDEPDGAVPTEPDDDADLVVFDALVFACGEQGDHASCAELMLLLDADAQIDLIDRCDTLDQVACGALNNTVIAQLQVECVYDGDTGACEGLELAFGIPEAGNHGLGNSLSQAPIAAIESDCATGSLLACAERNARQAGQGE